MYKEKMMQKEFYLKLIEKLENDSEVRAATILSGSRFGEKYFCGHEEQIEIEEGQPLVFHETIQGRISVVICGGGHVSLALAQILHLLEFYVIVMDDRKEFANQSRFPMADEIICLDYEKEFHKQTFDPNSYFVIVTRGHKADYVCLKDVLDRSFGYVGMIGSRSKVSLAYERLEREGVTKEKINTIHSPIGINIGAKTPMEIAVSIASELIQTKNKEERNVLEKEVVEGILQTLEESVMATLIEKKGSSPRGAGTRMVVLKSGKIFGTIGGGAVENAVIEKARNLCGSKDSYVEDYELTDSVAATLGMVCGGTVRVLFEPVYLKDE